MRVVAQANCCNLMRGESLTSRKKQADALCFPWCIERNSWARYLTAGVKREYLCQGGEIGILKRFKISRWKHHAGSSPAPGTITLGRISVYPQGVCIKISCIGDEMIMIGKPTWFWQGLDETENLPCCIPWQEAVQKRKRGVRTVPRVEH